MMRAGLVLVAACGFHATPSSAPASGDGTPDAGDAPADVAADGAPCPGTYDAGGHRLLATAMLWLDAEHACEADAPGSSHLVVIDDDTERGVLAGEIVAFGDVWVGIVRDPGGTAPWPWRAVTGGPAAYQPWEGSEPNNMSGNQYVGVMRATSGYLYDYGVDQLEYAACECDYHAASNADFDPTTN